MKKIVIFLALFCATCATHTNPPPAGEDAFVNGIKKLSLPLNVDTVFILTADTTQKLSCQDVRNFGVNFLDKASSHKFAYDFKEFCKIDSLKQHHRYAVYVNSLAIGMTKDAIAFKLGYAPLKDNAILLVWGITYSSYEACPVFSGTRIFGSYRNAKNKYTHVLLGESSSSTDPPAGYYKVLTTTISADEKFISKTLEVIDHTDAPGKNITVSELQFEPAGDTLKITRSNKKVTAREKAY
jgi:hypothetical protein